MGIFGRKKKSSKGDKNPQSGANSFSSSSAQSHESSHSDVNVPTVNLTEQRLLDWRAGGAANGGGNGGNGGGNVVGASGIVGGGGGKTPAPVVANGGTAANGGSANGKSWKNSASPPRSYSASPNNLILLIERGQWAAAAQRAISHESEAKQLVKLRKTTKNSGPPATSSANTGAEVAASPGGGGGVAIAPGLPQAGNDAASSGGGGGGGRGKRNLQISNVKCKALHHACQKLRSVHTTIYSKGAPLADPGAAANSGASGIGNTRRIIEEDEYIEACKCILALIKIHPEACKDRESRHGCLPLHLCVFSMCATPPPPLVMGSGCGAKKKKKGGLNVRISSGGINGGGGDGISASAREAGREKGQPQRPPASPGPAVAMGRSASAPMSNKDKNNSLNLPSTAKGHRNIPSSSSADFSLGNISQMIQEESEHLKGLTEHRESTKNGGGGGGMIPTLSETGSMTDKIYEGIDRIDQFLSGLESKYDAKEDKKKKRRSRSPRSPKGGKGDGSPRGGSPRAGGGKMTAPAPSSSDGLEAPSTILNAAAPLDRLEERSRETDSHSTPAQGKGAVKVTDERTGAAVSFSSSASTCKRGNVMSNLNIMSAMSLGHGGGGGGMSSTALPLRAPSSSSQPSYEDLQRRYLQINTQRRDEYSVKVINALLDAWPKSAKTSSEGGRLPLHMACFGKATVRVMETILKAYPDAARQRNHDGFLPIHIAAHWGVSHADIAPLILRAYPDGAVGRNRWERTPIEEALGMAGENGRDHQLSLVWSLRRHPTYWIHNDIGTMLLPRNVRTAPWRLVDAGDPADDGDEEGGKGGGGEGLTRSPSRVISRSAVDVDEVGTSDEEDQGVEVQMTQSSLTSGPNDDPNDPESVRALAESTDLSLLITKDKHWSAAAFRCRLFPHEAREAMEVKVRGAYTAKITPLHYACENRPTVEVIQTLIEAHEPALDRRQEPGGQLPLHAACTWGAGPDVVRALLAARPACAEMKDFLSNLPLHCACYSGAETPVLEALLRVYPQSVWPRNHQGSSAVDIVRRLAHPNRREALGLLEGTMARLLERAHAGEAAGGAGVEQDNSLEWV